MLNVRFSVENEQTNRMVIKGGQNQQIFHSVERIQKKEMWILFQPEKRLPKILGDLFRVKARNFTTNVPKILVLKSSSKQIFSKNRRWVPMIH